MNAAKLVVDPVWQCLCPSWASVAAKRFHRRAAIPLHRSPVQRTVSSRARQSATDKDLDFVFNPLQKIPLVPPVVEARSHANNTGGVAQRERIDLSKDSAQHLYGQLLRTAIDGQCDRTRKIAETLVGEKGEKPGLQIYNALILANVGASEGAAWRVAALLHDLEADGLQPDVTTCHAVLKVLSVHLDHLLRADVLDYMHRRWFQLSGDGWHDVTAGLFREGLFEEALKRMDMMKQQGIDVQNWLMDVAVYVLCEAGEISEAYRIMRERFDSGTMYISRGVWWFLLDKASGARHHLATELVWSSQVNQEYINPSSGMCLNVLATAAAAGDAVLATDVFSHLSKRGTAFQPIHYELLIETYLSTTPLDWQRAISILTIMALEKVEPSAAETRSLFAHLRDEPDLVPQALSHLRDLHGKGRKIPIAALNLLIECYVEQCNLPEALKLYKQIHTFVPMVEGAKKSFANIETFNLLLKGCRVADPPDEHQASFLVSELLALGIKPTALTYDRLILVFEYAGNQAINGSAKLDNLREITAKRTKGKELIDWAFRHFADMQGLGWIPRFGTLRVLALGLARLRDARCWDVLQAGEDNADGVEGWRQKGMWVRKTVEEAWNSAVHEDDGMKHHADNLGGEESSQSLL